MKTNLIAVKNTPAIISVNFEEIKKALSKDLEKYNVVVTADTLKGAKQLATEINATKKHIDTKRKEEVAKASEPVKAFDAQMKELQELCETGRQDILEQVKVFEDVTRETAKTLLREYRFKVWGDLGVEEEYQSAEYEDLATLSAVTAKGSLAKSAKDEIDRRVSSDKSLQDKTEKRLLLLENQSYKEGLAAPLTRDHVESFLFANDEEYQAQLDRILAAEVERQEKTEEVVRSSIEKASSQNETSVNYGASSGFAITTTEEPAPAGQAEFHIVCTFKTVVSDKATEEIIRAGFEEKLVEAGFTTLKFIDVTKLKAQP